MCRPFFVVVLMFALFTLLLLLLAVLSIEAAKSNVEIRLADSSPMQGVVILVVMINEFSNLFAGSENDSDMK
uniref:Uncharacterized protein n=1 Tax=Pristionchus pacificus TaxID=54126 RepID=A0A2A6BGR0_PRIPA|eukprot:PDM65001.1 hypothetical protein PRIPAC_53257 [Pristionchus pacificus]